MQKGVGYGLEENRQVSRPRLQAEQEVAPEKELGVEQEEEDNAFKH